MHDDAFKERLSAVPKVAARILELGIERHLGQVFNVIPEMSIRGMGEKWPT